MSLADELQKLAALRDSGVLTPAEFEQAKQRLLAGGPAPATGAQAASVVNRLRRSTTDKWLGGVCGGLARSTGVESWAWRLILALLFLFGGTGLLIYILLWIFVPAD